jgi:hypothetical protein
MFVTVMIKVEGKLSLCLIKHHAKETLGRVET